MGAGRWQAIWLARLALPIVLLVTTACGRLPLGARPVAAADVQRDLKQALDDLIARYGGCACHDSIPIIRSLTVTPTDDGAFAVDLVFLNTAPRLPDGSLDRDAILQDVYQLLRTVYASPHRIASVSIEGWVAASGSTAGTGWTPAVRGRLTAAAAATLDWEKATLAEIFAASQGVWLADGAGGSA